MSCGICLLSHIV
uniref:Uncharacterized protein n=1 Tax=Moniliophthora roreri TaxID=221103 RepID=A0A0W0GCT6_MONRR